MALASTSIPKPKNWQDFESNTRVLMSCVLRDPNTQQNGRSGQPQHGVDVYGSRRPGHIVGVQCKKKLDSKVTETELRAEVKKAKKFKPKLAKFILATTAPRDQAIQTVARQITDELLSTKHPMTVVVWGWDDIEEHCASHPEAYKAFDPSYNSFVDRGFEKMELQLKQLQESVMDRINNAVQSPTSQSSISSIDANTEDTPLHGKISAYISLIEEGHVQAALVQLQKTKEKEWANASRSERYRISVAFAAAKLRQGEFQAAGQQLLDAFPECPEHKKAKQNQAKGYLLTNDYAKAAATAAEVLRDNPENSDAASVLIQTRIHDPEIDSPLLDIAPQILDSEDVLLAYAHFLRCRDNPDWIPTAKEALRKHPDSEPLKFFAADAVIDELVQTKRAVLAGAPLRSVQYSELKKAAHVLKTEALKAIELGYGLAPWIANNAAVALRFMDDIEGAIQILDAAMVQHPAEPNFGLQRAVIAYSQNDLRTVLKTLPEDTTDVEAMPLLATALADTGEPDRALKILDAADFTSWPQHVRLGALSARVHAYIVRNEKALAIDTARRELLASPRDIHVRCVLIRAYYLTGEATAASDCLDECLTIVDGATDIPSRLLLSFEAVRLKRDDAIVGLLKDRVATDHDNEALRLLVRAAINGHFLVAAQEILSSISQDLRELEWVRRATTILAINTGDRNADQKIGDYLRSWPHDASMLLVRLAGWTRLKRNKDVQALLRDMDLEKLEGFPRDRIRIAALAINSGVVERGLKYAYAVLMDNWNDAKAHLVYQGLILMSEHLASVMPPDNVVAENTVVLISTAGGQRQYRLENLPHKVFEDERIELTSDLARLLVGKKVGDTFPLQDRVGAEQVMVSAIKPVYIDAFHRSLEQFNERFPRSNGMLKLRLDASAEDPLEDIRTITRERAESDRALIDQYRSKGIPLSFIAKFMGRDPLEAWAGLPSVDVQFQVCRGIPQERDEAFRTLTSRERKGCVADAITLCVIQRLNVADAVQAVCGPLHTTQSVLDLLAARVIEAEKNIGKKMGFLSWQDGRLVMQEYSEEVLAKAAEDRKAEHEWALNNAAIATAIPREDLSKDNQLIVKTMGAVACDPAIAANGQDLLLLSDDFGFRAWSTVALGVSTTWLQPILILARRESRISEDRYLSAITDLALAGHNYTSLESGVLLHKARATDFEASDDLMRLLDIVGGPSADVLTNCHVAGQFLDALLAECTDDFKLMRLSSQTFESLTKCRMHEQKGIVVQILKSVHGERRAWLGRQSLNWLIGHSIGTAEFDALVALQKEASVRKRAGAAQCAGNDFRGRLRESGEVFPV